MSDVIKTHFEPGKLGVSHWVCAACGEVFSADSIEWVWDSKSCTHVPKCPVCGIEREGDIITLNGTTLELERPVLKLRKKQRKVWIDVDPYLTKAGKLSTRKKVVEDETVFNPTRRVAEREREIVTGKEDVPCRVSIALSNLVTTFEPTINFFFRMVKDKKEKYNCEVGQDISIRLDVLKLLVRSDRMHPIRHANSWHGDPTRKTRKGFDGRFVNMGMWLNAMEGDMSMFDKAMDNAVANYEYWSGSKYATKRANAAERDAIDLITWREDLNKAGYLSMSRGMEVVDPADNRTRYTRWWDPNKLCFVKTGMYNEHRIVRYIDEMGGDESDNSIARPINSSPDESVISTEDIHYEWIDLDGQYRGYDKILRDEVIIGFDDTDCDPSCWVPDEVPNDMDMNALRAFAKSLRM